MKDFYTVKELARLCNVTEQAIRAYLAQHNCAKVAGKWQPTQDELQELFRHYGVNVAQITQETQDNCAINAKNTNAVAQVAQDEKTAGQQRNLDLIEELRAQIEELKRDKSYLQQQNTDLQEQNKQLTLSVQSLTETNKALAAANAVQIAADKKELLIESVEAKQETQGETIQETKEENEQPQKKRGFWARLFDL